MSPARHNYPEISKSESLDEIVIDKEAFDSGFEKQKGETPTGEFYVNTDNPVARHMEKFHIVEHDENEDPSTIHGEKGYLSFEKVETKVEDGKIEEVVWGEGYIDGQKYSRSFGNKKTFVKKWLNKIYEMVGAKK